jgi:hypothetical protein
VLLLATQAERLQHFEIRILFPSKIMLAYQPFALLQQD